MKEEQIVRYLELSIQYFAKITAQRNIPMVEKYR